MGGCKCTFRRCNVSTQKFPHMTFFHYPLSKKERLEKWIQYANYSIINTMLIGQAKNRLVCGLHFKDDCFMNYKKNRLTPTAVPTLHRMKNGKVLDYSVSNNPKPTTISPTMYVHLVPPEGTLIWGKPADFWNTYSTIGIVYSGKLRQTSETPRILNKGVRMISNVPLNTNFEIDETTTISLNDVVFPQGDDDDVVVENCNLESRTNPETNLTNLDSNVDRILNIEGVEFITEEPIEPVRELVSKSTLEATCNAYEGVISALREGIHTREEEAELEVAGLKVALEQTRTKLQESENMATAWKFKATEYERKIADLESKNLALLTEKAAEPLAVTPRPALTLPSSSLTKPQLFNGMKKYLSASMTALVRMEMFGSSERPWKPDEKQVSIELMKLGEEVYQYFRDEWRFRLPPQKMVEEWMNEVAEEDVEDL